MTGAKMIDPADLKDPAKAESFLRETIDGLAADITRTEIEIAEEIRSFSEQNADDPEAVANHTRRMLARREMRIGFLQNDLKRLTEYIDSYDAAMKRLLQTRLALHGSETTFE